MFWGVFQRSWNRISRPILSRTHLHDRSTMVRFRTRTLWPDSKRSDKNLYFLFFFSNHNNIHLINFIMWEMLWFLFSIESYPSLRSVANKSCVPTLASVFNPYIPTKSFLYITRNTDISYLQIHAGYFKSSNTSESLYRNMSSVKCWL